MFNKEHIIFMVTAAVISVLGLVLCGIFIKQEKYKRLVLKISAILTVIFHFSTLYVDFFTTGTATVESPMLLPIYPCNVLMWLLLICAFKKDNKSKIGKILFEFTFYAGVVCGLIGLIFNENFAANPTLSDYFSLRGLLSHTTMVYGCIYILVGKFIKLDVSNCISVFFGLCLFLLDGFLINGLYKAFGLDPVNSMYLLEIPFENMPWLNTYVMGLLGMLLVFIVTLIIERFSLKKEERFLYKITNKIKSLNSSKKINEKGENL